MNRIWFWNDILRILGFIRSVPHKTRMHARRIRTARCSGRHYLLWSLCPGGLCLRGVSVWAERGICLGRSPTDTYMYTPCEQNDWHALVKTSPYPKLHLRTVKVKPLILHHPEQVMARLSALWDGSKWNNFEPFWRWKKTPRGKPPGIGCERWKTSHMRPRVEPRL